MAGMTLFDWFVVIIILLSTIMAAAQGLVLELVSLAALVLGLWLAFWNYHVLATPLSHVIHSEGIADVVAFLLIALGVMLVIGLIGRAISKVARTVGPGWAGQFIRRDIWSDSRLFPGGGCYHSYCCFRTPEKLAARIEAGAVLSVGGQ